MTQRILTQVTQAHIYIYNYNIYNYIDGTCGKAIIEMALKAIKIFSIKMEDVGTLKPKSM